MINFDIKAEAAKASFNQGYDDQCYGKVNRFALANADYAAGVEQAKKDWSFKPEENQK